VAFYATERFPDITSVSWLTRIKHTLSSKKTLAKLAMKEGLENFVLYDQNFMSAGELRKVNWYDSLMEDTLESFCGVMVYVLTKEGFHRGVGIQIANNILETFYQTLDISVRYEDLFDGISRLKELYESTVLGLRWANATNDVYYIIENNDNTFTVRVNTWLLGDKTYDPANKGNNRYIIPGTEATHRDKEMAKQMAAEKTLQRLKDDYNIFVVPPPKN
jgi:dsRNA-specific ribonuclease